MRRRSCIWTRTRSVRLGWVGLGEAGRGGVGGVGVGWGAAGRGRRDSKDPFFKERIEN